ncbi:MAG: hypothetical protein ACI90V_010087 [Bacillariaceae sp.]|jgi:hypothetical protein
MLIRLALVIVAGRGCFVEGDCLRLRMVIANTLRTIRYGQTL